MRPSSETHQRAHLDFLVFLDLVAVSECRHQSSVFLLLELSLLGGGLASTFLAGVLFAVLANGDGHGRNLDIALSRLVISLGNLVLGILLSSDIVPVLRNGSRQCQPDFKHDTPSQC